jgi:hypothetical protein
VFAPARPQLSRGIFFTGDGNQQLSPDTAQTLSIGELGGAFSGLGLGLCMMRIQAGWNLLTGTRSFIGESSRPAAERGDGPGLALAP